MGEQFEAGKFKHFCGVMAGKKGFNCKVVVFGEADVQFAEGIAKAWVNMGFDLKDFYLSQGNPFPPGHSPSAPDNFTWVLRNEYLHLFDLIKNMPYLAHTKFLPQWHVWLWGNRQGV